MGDDCPEPDRCYNCREEGHTTADCPEPEKCRRCRKEGHKVDECPEPVKCGKCGEEGHMRRDCTNEEQTYIYTNEEGETKEMYVPRLALGRLPHSSYPFSTDSSKRT